MLPFHQMGRFKWEKLGLNYSLEDTQPPSTELVQRVWPSSAQAGLTAY